MTKLLYLIKLITYSVLIIQVNAISFFNNHTLPNDILSRTFFDHIKNKNFSTTELEGSERCTRAIKEIINRVPSLNVLPFIDAWGNIPSGLLYGHWKDLGNFDECVDISTNLDEPIGLTNGKYCFASIPISDAQTMRPWWDPEIKAKRNAYQVSLMISIGICVPDFCDPDFLTEVFQNATTDVLNGTFKDVVVNNCITAEMPSFEVIDIIGIILFSTVGLMMLLSTLYDIYADTFNKKVNEILLAFSIITNGRKLFKINYFKSDNNISCLIGIRVLSMVWIIFCHCYSLSALQPIINSFEYLPWFNAESSLHVLMGTVSVDTFFLISGLLVAWLGLLELDKRNGKLNIPLMYFHRYIRLTPPIVAVIIHTLVFDKYIGTGPLKETYNVILGDCKEKWWTTLLGIQNYANPLTICIPQTWYLAVDTQLYFLSPLILVPLWKWGRKFIPVMFLLSFLSLGYVIAIYFHYGFTSFVGLLEDDQMTLTYTPTHARCSVWLMGVGLGYLMHKIKSKPIRLSKLIQTLNWGVCFALFIAVIYGPYYLTISADHENTVFEAAMYETFRRVLWGVALSWLIFACHFGYGGLINSFLSHEMWQPISRLTYCMFLAHFNVQIFNYGIKKTDVYFSDYSTILVFWSTFGITFVAAIVLTLSFEAPVLVIEKLLLKRDNREIGQEKKTTSKTQLDMSQKLP